MSGLTFSGKKCLSGKVICAFFVPLIEVLLYKNSPGLFYPTSIHSPIDERSEFSAATSGTF
jgi:hypothetical protein